MKFFGNKTESLTGSKVPRIAKMSDSELLSWFNNLIMEVGINFDQWRYHDAPLEELGTSVDLLTDIWTEIRARKSGRDNPG